MKIEELQSKTHLCEKAFLSECFSLSQGNYIYSVTDRWGIFLDAKNTILEFHSNAIIFALECFTFF